MDFIGNLTLSSYDSDPITRSTAYTPAPVTQLLCCTLPVCCLLFLTLLLVSFSSPWDETVVKATRLSFTLPPPVSAKRIFSNVSVEGFCPRSDPSGVSPEPECRWRWRRQSWQRRGSKMLG